jgi:ribonuclease Y
LDAREAPGRKACSCHRRGLPAGLNPDRSQQPDRLAPEPPQCELQRRRARTVEPLHAIEAHHNEVEARTVEAVLTQAADAISGGRPGARRESLESYVRRLERLEQIASAHEGVEKVFAMQAGREIRVMVKPDSVDDIQAQVIARDIAKQVEEELTYPGQIRITVVRESRAMEFAR